MKKYDCISDLSDFEGTLGELKKIVDLLLKDYKKSAKCKFDAGYNNVSFYIQNNGN